MQLNVQEIMEIIPNRYPIMMVDKVTELEPGKYVKAIKNVTYNESFFPGHFPGEPVMPCFNFRSFSSNRINSFT